MSLRLSDNLAITLPPGVPLLEGSDVFELAWEFEGLGKLPAARAMLRELEAGLWRKRAAMLAKGVDSSLTKSDLHLLGLADMRLHEASVAKEAKDHATARARAADARRLVMIVHVRLTSTSDSRWIEHKLTEIVALEVGAGGDFSRERMGPGNPLVLADRDGFHLLCRLEESEVRDGKTITRPLVSWEQRNAGNNYRALYEKTDPKRSLKPAPVNPDARGGVHHGGDGWAEVRAKFWDDRRGYDRAILGAVGEQGLRDVWAVVGEGESIRGLYPGGKGREAATRRVLAGLSELSYAMRFARRPRSAAA